MNEIIKTLEALTSNEVRGDLKLFKTLYGSSAIDKLNLEHIKDFSFWDNGQSVIIYSGRKIIFDCNYEICYGLKRFTTCYNLDGLYYKFSNY